MFHSPLPFPPSFGFHPLPPLRGQGVESSQNAVAVGRAYPFAPRFLWECLSSHSVSSFPALLLFIPSALP